MKKIVCIALLAVLAVSSFSFLNSASAETDIGKTWVLMHGIITQWGDAPAFGFIQANAHKSDMNGTLRQWARVHAIWSTKPRDINDSLPTGNFTIECYGARLINTTMVALDYSGYDFYILGKWDVVHIINTFSFNEQGELISFTHTIESVVVNQTGELRVINGWKNFELDITGISLLKGIVRSYMIRNLEIKIFDLTGDGKVTIRELVRIARNYGNKLGLRSYSFDYDLNFDGQIDIGDLATIAANLD